MGGKRRALIADDDREVRVLLEEALHEDFDCSVVCTGHEAYLLASRPNSFSVLVLDIHMPLWDGFDTLAMLQTMNPDLNVIIFTGSADVEQDDSLSDFPCVKKVILKPCPLNGLREQVLSIL